MFFSRPKIDGPPTVQPGEPVIAFLLLAQPEFPVADAVEKLRALPFATNMSNTSAEDGTVAFYLGDETVGISSVGTPYPDSLEFPYNSSWMFPDAATALSNHAGFVTIALTGGAGDPAQRRATLTRLTAALAHEAGVIGIYWPDAVAVIRPDVFIQMTERTLTDKVFPAYLWLNMQVWNNNDGTNSLATTGLNKFGRYEIEVINVMVKPSGLREFVYGAAHTLILDNPPIKDGMEVARFGSSILRASLKPSVWEGRGTVIRMQT